MFKGANKLNLDAKGRFAIPTRYRDELREACASKLVVTIDPDDYCLFIYPAPEWEEIERKIMRLPTFNSASRRLQRAMVGHAIEVDMDSQGRVLLTTPLREFARLNKHVVLIGQGNKFELWDEERWNHMRDSWREQPYSEQSDLPVDLETLSI